MTMTTIGYGDIVPLTDTGKVMAMVFALSGVPIFVGIVGLIFESRIKNTISKHMEELEKELIETEEKLEETEGKLLTEERKLVKIERHKIRENQEKKI
jgi:voltage-gated potassium channel Kch